MAHCNRNDGSWQTGIVAHSHWIGGSFECRLFIYSYFCENNSKLTKFDYVGDWLSKFVTGIITGLFNVSIYAGVIEKFIYKNNAIIDVAIMMVMVMIIGILHEINPLNKEKLQMNSLKSKMKNMLFYLKLMTKF